MRTRLAPLIVVKQELLATDYSDDNNLISENDEINNNINYSNSNSNSDIHYLNGGDLNNNNQSSEDFLLVAEKKCM